MVKFSKFQVQQYQRELMTLQELDILDDEDVEDESVSAIQTASPDNIRDVVNNNRELKRINCSIIKAKCLLQHCHENNKEKVSKCKFLIMTHWSTDKLLFVELCQGVMDIQLILVTGETSLQSP